MAANSCPLTSEIVAESAAAAAGNVSARLAVIARSAFSLQARAIVATTTTNESGIPTRDDIDPSTDWCDPARGRGDSAGVRDANVDLDPERETCKAMKLAHL